MTNPTMRGIVHALLFTTLSSGTFGATNGIQDTQSAYEYPTVWSTVDTLRLKTFVTAETDNVTYNQMYNDPAGDPKKKMGVCIQSDDYADPLTIPCGEINVRGASSREADLKSLKVKLYKTAPLGKWRGRRDIILIKSPWDMGRLRNAVAYELISGIDGFIGIGVAYVHLLVDDRDFGLYQVVEDLDDDYLENHALGKDDFLLKADDFEWSPPKNGFVPNGDNPINKEWLDAKVGDDTLEWYDEMVLITTALRDATDDKDCTAAEAVISQYIDVESLTTFIAINTIMLEYDVLNHNFLLYRPATGGKWSHLFWDKDQGLDFQRQLYEIEEYTKHPVGDTYRFGVMFEMAMTYNNLYISFLRVKGHFEKVKAKVAELTAHGGPLSGVRFAEVINKYATRVRSFVPLGYAESVDFDEFDNEISRLLDVYSDPSQLFAEFEEKRWGSNSKSRPFCEPWAADPTPTVTAAPSSAPSLSPVVSPVVTPALSSTASPVVSPVSFPSISPVISPTVSPANSPVASSAASTTPFASSSASPSLEPSPIPSPVPTPSRGPAERLRCGQVAFGLCGGQYNTNKKCCRDSGNCGWVNPKVKCESSFCCSGRIGRHYRYCGEIDADCPNGYKEDTKCCKRPGKCNSPPWAKIKCNSSSCCSP